MVQIQSDIVLAFILLVMFNFGMNLFLFYKWHKAIDEGKEALVEQHRFDNLDYDEWYDEVMQKHGTKKPSKSTTPTPAYDLGKK